MDLKLIGPAGRELGILSISAEMDLASVRRKLLRGRLRIAAIDKPAPRAKQMSTKQHKTLAGRG